MLEFAIPPSVLPDISPTRGENDSLHDHRPQQTLIAEHTKHVLGRTAPHLLSPLEGEMSGRTEGGSSKHWGKIPC